MAKTRTTTPAKAAASVVWAATYAPTADAVDVLGLLLVVVEGLLLPVVVLPVTGVVPLPLVVLGVPPPVVPPPCQCDFCSDSRQGKRSSHTKKKGLPRNFAGRRKRMRCLLTN